MTSSQYPNVTDELLSAYLDDEKFQKMKEYGADLCFSKPLPLPQLKEEVATIFPSRNWLTYISDSLF